MIIFIKNQAHNLQVNIEFNSESLEKWYGVVFLSELSDEL